MLGLIISISGQAQTDTTDYQVYDIIYLTKGGSMKGEILSFDEETGGLVFKDIYGRKYSLGREEYEYFVEDKAFPVRRKSDKPLKARKQDGLSFHVGLSTGILNIPINFDEDDYYFNAPDALSETPILLKIGGGKQLNRESFFGATVEVGLSTYSESFFNAGARYTYQYDAANGNVGFYVPFELKFQTMKFETVYTVADTVYWSEGFSVWSKDHEVDVQLTSVNLSLGHGFAFMLPNEKSLSLEVALVKHFVLSQEFSNTYFIDPQATYDVIGGRFALLFNL